MSVTRLAIYPSFLIVTTTANFDVKNVKELVDHAKKNPGKVRYTSAGVGSFPHYDMEVFARRAGVDMIHIPNKTGAAGMINDLVVGDAQVAFLNSASSAAMIKAGKLRPIAVVAEQRLPDYPDVPTMAEAGFPDVGTLHWQSMLAPAQTPKPVLDTLFKAIGEAAEGAGAAGGVRQAARQRQAERVARRGADLAQERARRLAQDHGRGEDRSDGLSCSCRRARRSILMMRADRDRYEFGIRDSDAGEADGQVWCAHCCRSPACLLVLRRRRRTNIRPSRSGSWCRSPPAARPTSPSASSASRCASRPATAS